MSSNGMLKWWVIVISILVAAVYCFILGYFHQLWSVDISKLSFLILGLTALVSVYIGHLTYRAEKYWFASRQVIDTYIQPCRFSAQMMTELGMLGTVIGFLFMLGPAFAGGDLLADPSATISNMAVGMATALTTTLIGIVCSLIIKVQLVNLDVICDTQEVRYNDEI